MKNTKPLSKRVRFEIFKRDGFTCQYCGQRPPEVILEVDHIEPRANGGDNGQINLITSCSDCNRGKSDKPLVMRAVRPDANLELLEAQQEIAEAQQFLIVQRRREEVLRSVIGVLQDHWESTLQTKDDDGDFSVPAEHIIRGWLARHSPEDVCDAINRAAPAVSADVYKKRFRYFNNYLSYIGGILRNMREMAQ